MDDKFAADIQGRIMALEFISRRLLAQTFVSHTDQPLSALREQRGQTLDSLQNLQPAPKTSFDHNCHDAMRLALEQLFDETEQVIKNR